MGWEQRVHSISVDRAKRGHVRIMGRKSFGDQTLELSSIHREQPMRFTHKNYLTRMSPVCRVVSKASGQIPVA